MKNSDLSILIKNLLLLRFCTNDKVRASDAQNRKKTNAIQVEILNWCRSVLCQRSLNLESKIWCRQFSQKTNENKFDLRFHSTLLGQFFFSFDFMRIEDILNCFQVFLTFSLAGKKLCIGMNTSTVHILYYVSILQYCCIGFSQGFPRELSYRNHFFYYDKS